MASSTNDEPSPLFFWREFDPGVDYLSQWYPIDFTVDGITYCTAEMWMMTQKAKLFGDDDSLQQMLRTKNPKEHQALGRAVKGYDGKIWNEHKSRIVEEGNYHKFGKSGPEAGLKQKLLSTGDRMLVEASPSDRIWGIGFNEQQAMQNMPSWGLNLLGKAIMVARQRLRDEDGAAGGASL